MPPRSLPRFSVALSALLSLAACASITSSDSVSESVAASLESLTSPFTSSSAVGESEAASSYRRDVQSYTAAYLQDETVQGEYLRGLAQVAGLHGITDWEADQNTLGAIREIALDGRLAERGLQRLRAELSPLGEELVRSTLDGDS